MQHTAHLRFNRAPTQVYTVHTGKIVVIDPRMTETAMNATQHLQVAPKSDQSLLYGIARSKRPADEKHPFGYASEIYFWAFIVAILIFSIGAGISLYHGIEKVLHPHPVEDPMINYVILISART